MFRSMIDTGEVMEAENFKTVYKNARLTVRWNARHYGQLSKAVIFNAIGSAVCTIVAYDGAFGVYPNY